MDRYEWTGIRAVAIVSGAVAGLAGASPTGTAIWDVVLCAAVGAGTAFACGRSPRWVAISAIGVAAAFGGISAWTIAAWCGLFVGVLLAVLDRRSRLLTAVLGAIAAQVLLRLPDFGFFGLPSIIAGLTFALVAIGAYRHAHKPTRRHVRRAAGLAITACTLLLLIGGALFLRARSDVEVGLASAQRALTAARIGDTAGASEELARSEQLLTRALDRLTSPPARTLRLLPVVAQHHQAVEQAVAVGAQVAADASTVRSDLEALEGAFQPDSGALTSIGELAPRLATIAESLAEGQRVLDASTSPWLVPPVADRLRSTSNEIDQLVGHVALAADATRIMPDMLGAREPQHYLVFFATPAESRELGGFIGSYARIEVADAAIEVLGSGRISDLYETAQASEIDPSTSLEWYLEMARPTTYPQNLTSAPDFRFVAEMTRQVLGDASEEPLAGVIYVDAVALIDVLEITGPVDVPFRSEPLTRDNAAAFFYRDQYEFAGLERTELFGSLSDVAVSVLAEFASQRLPDPEELGRVLGPAARAGHLQVVTFDDAENAFLESVKLLRAFDQGSATDFVGLVQANGLPNKMDLYLQRSLDYDVTVDEDRTLEATATVTLRSVVPPDAPAYTLGQDQYGARNEVVLSLYSPHVLRSVQVDGAEASFQQSHEFGLNRYLLQVDVEPTGAPHEIVYDLVGNLTAADYSLRVWQQALINRDDVSVRYRGPGGRLEWDGPLDQALDLEPS